MLNERAVNARANRMLLLGRRRKTVQFDTLGKKIHIFTRPMRCDVTPDIADRIRRTLEWQSPYSKEASGAGETCRHLGVFTDLDLCRYQRRRNVVGLCPTSPLKGDHTMTTGTVRLHRVLRATPERIYRAFLEPDAIAKWLPPYGFTCQVHHMDARVGGTHKMSFRNFTTGNSHSFGGEYVELVPFEKIRYSDRFDNANLPGQMDVTISLRQVSCGTELTVVQEGIPEVIPVEMCYLGWQESLVQLAKLVEPEIPD
jgi:uncharacterized protein YndB with AHSA1/START domain